MDQFELSLSPVFNEVIRCAEAVYYTPAEPSYHEDLAQALRSMAEFLQFLAKSFQEAMKIRPKTELSEQAPKEFAKELENITSVLSELKSRLNSEKTDHIPEQLQKGRQALVKMFDIFERMKKEEESFPVFSKSPYIQEIVRIAAGVAKNQYKPETLREKLHWLRDRYLEFKDDFAGFKDIPKENEEVEKLVPIAQQALTKMGTALDKMAAFLRTYDKQQLKDGCAELLQSTEVLIAVQERLLKASTAQPAACPSCGTMNPGGAKRCRNCSAQMPEIVGLSTQTIEIKENAPEDRGPSYTYLVRLEGACRSYKNKLLSFDDIKREIKFFAEKVKGGREQFAQMKQKAASDESSQSEAALQCYAKMEEGIGRLTEGVQYLEKFIASQEEELIDKGLELISIGAEDMTAAQTIASSSN